MLPPGKALAMSPGGVELKKAFLARFEAEDWMREGREGFVFWVSLLLLLLLLLLMVVVVLFSGEVVLGFVVLVLVLDDGGGGGVWSDMAGGQSGCTPEYAS